MSGHHDANSDGALRAERVIALRATTGGGGMLPPAPVVLLRRDRGSGGERGFVLVRMERTSFQ